MRWKAAWLVVLVCAAACAGTRPGAALRPHAGSRPNSAPPAPSPAPAAPVLETTDAATILAGVRERENDVHSLRATFESITTENDEIQRESDGILLVRKPDMFRLRLTTPFGLTAFDYLSRPDGVHVVSPYAASDAAHASPLPFSEDELRAIFLRGDQAFPEQCAGTIARPDELTVDCRARSGALLRTIIIDVPTGQIREERSYRDGELSLLLQNDDYRAAGPAYLPYRIVLTYVPTNTRVDILIRSYEVNPQLDERLFAPVAG